MARLTTPNVSGSFWTSALTQTAVQTSNYTALPNQIVPVSTASGNVTVTLPQGAPSGSIVAVKMVTLGGSNTVTVQAVSGDVFNKAGGGTTLTLSLSSQGVILEYQAGIWMVLSDDLPLGQLDSRYLQLSGGTMSGAIAMGSNKITGLTNGSGAQDAAAFGQAPGGIMTTAGDLLYENATPAPARLAVGTATGASGQFLGVSGSGLPSWQQVSGQFLCTPTQYAPASETTLTVTGTTMAAFSSANVNTGSFTAPASGSVLVTASFVADNGTPGTGINIGLAAHGTVTPIVGNISTWFDGATTTGRAYSVRFLIAGLTPGTSYNFDLLGGNGSSGDSVSIFAAGNTSTTATGTTGAPVIMTVQAV